MTQSVVISYHLEPVTEIECRQLASSISQLLTALEDGVDLVVAVLSWG